MIEGFDTGDFRIWQIEHYSQRLKDARTTEEKSFVRGELHNLKKANDNHDSALDIGNSNGCILDSEATLGRQTA